MNLPQKAAEAAKVEKITLDSGLTVLVKPMPEYRSVHAIYATKFGSVDRNFTVDGKNVCLPAGVAHFLEHKMFESEDGDAFSKYAKTGAAANAYTSFDKTCYIFTASDRVDESLDILLSMVGKPYFTRQTIAKEQGIIGQEIKMYDDNPDWRIMMALFQGMYHKNPVRDDIAGSVQSIAEITPEMLYDCCKAFYQPANMVLSVAGNVTREQVIAACARAGLTTPQESHATCRVVANEPAAVCKKEIEFSMPLAKTVFGIGFKETPLAERDVKDEMIHEMLTDLICGGMTPLYRRLYDSGLVNPEFDGENLELPGCSCVMFTGESEQPEQVRALLLEEIARLRREGVDGELFTLIKNQMYGELVTAMENVEDTAGSMTNSFLRGRTLVDELAALAALTCADVDAALQTMLLEENSVFVQIKPQR